MKTTDRKTPAQRPTASADRPGDGNRSGGAGPEDPAFAHHPAPVIDDRSGLFTGGETLH